MAATLDVGSLNITFCPPPFLADSAFPDTGGYLPGRYCGKLTGDLSCCLPCPIEKIVYTDRFNSLMDASHWLNIPSLALQCLLLLTFIVLKEDHSHGNFLNYGLCISIIMLQLGFLIPLGTHPEMCHDTITPNDMYSDISCAWTGALVVTGAMACASWVMLRSLFIHLKLCWGFDEKKHKKIFKWVFNVFGWGLPALFLALTLPITGVSYRLGPTCVPNQKNSFVTWFGWLIAFGCIAALLTTCTTIYCLWIYLRASMRKNKNGLSGTRSTGMNSTTRDEDKDLAPDQQLPQSGWTSKNTLRKQAWENVKKVLKAQLRSILLSTLVIVMVLYYGTVFVKQTNTGLDAVNPDRQASVTTWALCIVVNNGDKKKCEALSHVLGLDENAVIAAWFIAGLVGTFTFLLMVRRDMLNGWKEFFTRGPRKYHRTGSLSNNDHMALDDEETKKVSLMEKLKLAKHSSDDNVKDHGSIEEMPQMPRINNDNYELSPISPQEPLSPLLATSRFGSSTAVNEHAAALTSHAPDDRKPTAYPGQDRWSAYTDTTGTPSFSHEAGDVTRRHETTNLFFDEGTPDVQTGRTTSNRKLDNIL